MRKEKKKHALNLLPCYAWHGWSMHLTRGLTFIHPTNTGNSMADEQKKEDAGPPLALPPPSRDDDTTPNSSNNEDTVRTITADGGSVKLDHLGPIIINTDGTVARIANWHALTEAEQAVALRRIAKRNKERAQQLSQGAAADGEDHA